ncbi:MAG: hypothetical protein QW177_07170 [Candidatus Nitrosotenuis sp.]
MEKILEIRQMIQSKSASARKPDRDARRLLLYVFTARRGGYTRLQIISHLSERPMNTNQLALEMK